MPGAPGHRATGPGQAGEEEEKQVWCGEKSHDWGAEGAEGTEHGTDTAPGESRDYCRGFLRPPSSAVAEVVKLPRQQPAQVGASAPRPRGAEQQDGVEGPSFPRIVSKLAAAKN